MNKLAIKQVTFRNFKSYGNKKETFIFPPAGQTMLVEGDVGAGKSSILDAITYGFVGSKAFSKTIVNCVSQKQCVIECDLMLNGKPISIVRGTKPSLFNVTGLGKSVNMDMQARLDELLHITSKQALYNICMLSSSKTLPFFSLDKQERLKFIRNFVDSTLLDNLITISKSEESGLKLVCSEKEGSVRAMTDNLARIERMISETITEAQVIKERIDIERKNIESKLNPDADILKATKKLEELLSSLQSLAVREDGCKEELARLNGAHSIHQKTWDEIKGTISHISSVEDIHLALENNIHQLVTVIEEKTSLISKITETLSRLPSENEFNQILDLVAKDHSQLLNERTKTQNDLDQLKITTNDLISSRDEMIQDKDNIDSTDCVAYFNRLVDELNMSITSNESKMLGYKDKLLELSESINDIVRSETEVKEKYADFNKIVVILAETTAQLNDSESALVSLRKEKNTFITAFTQFLDSQNIIKECEKKLIKIQDECVKIKELIDIFQDILTQEDVMRKRLESLNSEYESATPNLDKMEAEAISARQLLEDESISIEQSKRKYLVTGAYRDILDEVWSYITQRIIPQLNSKLPYYTERLGLGFSMKINPRDITKPVFSGRPGISSLSLKDDLSDGQKRLISLALAHSLRDMEASVRGIEVGWLIIDEFANSLSPQLVEQVINFEKDFAKEKNVSLIVISHDVPLKSFQWDHRTTITRDTYSRIHQKF